MGGNWKKDGDWTDQKKSVWHIKASDYLSDKFKGIFNLSEKWEDVIRKTD